MDRRNFFKGILVAGYSLAAAHFGYNAVRERAFLSKPYSMTVIGVGGGGCNAVSSMLDLGLQDVKFAAVNTDKEALDLSEVPIKIQIGSKLRMGKGSGRDPRIGRMAALESANELRSILSGVDVVCLVATMGGGTGTGAAPVIARLSRETGAYTVAVVSEPFLFEGATTIDHAQQGIAMVRKYVDRVVPYSNERLICNPSIDTLRVSDLFKLSDKEASRLVRDIRNIFS